MFHSLLKKFAGIASYWNSILAIRDRSQSQTSMQVNKQLVNAQQYQQRDFLIDHHHEEIVMAVQPGIYKHFKGHTYRVIGTAKHSESLEEHVVYVSTTDPEDMWVRPSNMFLDIVERDGQKFHRFERLDGK